MIYFFSGDFRFRRDGNLLLVRYKDKKEIYFLSLIHGIKIERVPKRGKEETAASKLSLVNDYNKFMGGVDRNDALIGNYSSVRKTLKRTVKVVFHFIEEAFLNAYILNEKFGVKKMRFLAFKLEIIESIITKNQLPELQIYEHPKLGRHYVELIPPTEKKATSQKRCAVCSKSNKRKKSRYQCKHCSSHPGLYPSLCFEKFHT